MDDQCLIDLYSQLKIKGNKPKKNAKTGMLSQIELPQSKFPDNN